MLDDLIFGIAVWFAQLPPPGLLILLIIVLGLPSTLIHELGHGVAANVVAKVDARIELSFVGIDWAGLCRFDGDGEISMRDYAAVIVAGPLASLAQGVAATWLTAMATPNTLTHAVLATFALAGYLGAALNLVPLVHGGLRSDGQLLLDLGRWAVRGHVPEWIAAAREQADPHAAVSVAPPGR